MATWQQLYVAIIRGANIDDIICDLELKPSRLATLMGSRHLLKALEERRKLGELVAYANASAHAAEAVDTLGRLARTCLEQTSPDVARKAAMAILRLAKDAQARLAEFGEAKAEEATEAANIEYPSAEPQNGEVKTPPEDVLEAPPVRAGIDSPRPQVARDEEAPVPGSTGSPLRRGEPEAASKTFPVVPGCAAPFPTVARMSRKMAERMTRKMLRDHGFSDPADTGVRRLVTHGKEDGPFAPRAAVAAGAIEKAKGT